MRSTTLAILALALASVVVLAGCGDKSKKESTGLGDDKDRRCDFGWK